MCGHFGTQANSLCGNSYPHFPFYTASHFWKPLILLHFPQLKPWHSTCI